LQDASDATLATLKAIPHPISRQAQILVEVCSFIATGNVLRVQKLVQLCGEHLDALKEKEAESAEGKEEKKDEKKDEKKSDDTFQSFAVLGIAMIAMGEDIGAEMSMRQFNHLVYLVGRTSPAILLIAVNLRCTMAIPSSANLSLLLLVSLAPRIRSSPFLIRFQNTVMTMTSR